MKEKLITKQFGHFFSQKIKVSDHNDRNQFFLKNIKNKKCLHIGCADWPIYNPRNNLHLFLCSHHKNIDGYDVDENTINTMIESKLYPENSLFHTFPQKKYEILLIPETIEHVMNVESFFLSTIELAEKEMEIIVTGPNCFRRQRATQAYKMNQNEWMETVHSDHNCWFSPFTLPNFVEKCYRNSGFNFEALEIGTLEDTKMVFVHAKLSRNDSL